MTGSTIGNASYVEAMVHTDHGCDSKWHSYMLMG